jgi:PAS domain S-box-containing protein
MTTLLRTEQELPASVDENAERLGMLVGSVEDYAIVVLGADGKVASWNAGAERIKGYGAHEVLGRHCSMFYTEEDVRAGKPERDLEVATRLGRHSEESLRVRKDGVRFLANVTLTALRDERGCLRGFGKVTRDVTQRRSAEEKLRERSEDLERRVQQRTADLLAANQELEAFSYSVSHDLRAPLRALDGFSRLLLDQTAEKLNDQERDYLRRIRAAAQRMAQLTDAMSTLARLTRTPIDPQPTDVTLLVEGVVGELRQSTPQRDVQVVVAPGLQARADRRLARAVFENVLRNAWQFTRDAVSPRIDVDAVNDGGETVFFVRDNGAGFDPALKSKLFLPFQRLHRAKEFEGSGIGLATVSRIVQRHGGRIWADSSPGNGATFYFSFGKGG